MATADPVVERLYQSYCAALASLNLQGPSSIVVALGCGVDSQSVLDMTLRYRKAHPQHRYLAIHLDHFFHPDSPKWAEFLRQHCLDVGIEHIVQPIKVEVGARQSKEAAGREERYRGLAQLTDDEAVILLGHHSTDQAETFLLQMKRGSGPKGLSAMAAVAPFKGQRRLCRPLLAHSKAEIYAYANARGVPWIEDDTNQDTRIERNFIRHCILPPLRERWPAVESTIGRSARLCAEQQELTELLLAERLETLLLKQPPHTGAVSVAGLSQQPLIMQKALVRLFLSGKGAKSPSEALLLSLLERLEHSGACIEWGDWQLRRSGPALHLLPRQASEPYQLIWQGQPLLPLPDNLGLIVVAAAESGDKNALNLPGDGTVEIRNLHSGDKWASDAEKSPRSVRRLLKKKGVLPWQCDAWPVMVVNGQLAWVAGLGPDARFTSKTEESGAQSRWYTAEWQTAFK